MVASSLLAMALMLRADDRSEAVTRWSAVVVAGLSILVKPMIAPMLIGWWVALTVHRRGWRGLVGLRHGAQLVLMGGPTIAYYLHGMFTQTALGGWMGGSFHHSGVPVARRRAAAGGPGRLCRRTGRAAR